MERSKRRNNKNQGKKAPRVPIKTYKWEDIRRSRRKGGYPWTYLYKQPYDEEIDPEEFTMEGFRRSKSTSTIGKDLEITEITNDDPDEVSKGIVEEVSDKNHSKEDIHIDKPEIYAMESAESSDNISQYLDKDDERPPQQRQLDSTETLTLTAGPSELENGRQERAKSEETKRKRRLSMESTESRKSLSKLNVLKRLKEAKEKITFKKIGLPPIHPKKPKKDAPKDKKVEAPKKATTISKPKYNEIPVYIHIPLKPPEGQTDEFSYLEFEEKRPEIKIETTPAETDKTQEEKPTEQKTEQTVDGLKPIFATDDDDISAIIVMEGDDSNTDGEYDIVVVDMDDASKEVTVEEVTCDKIKKQVYDSLRRADSQGELSKGKTSRPVSRSSSKAKADSQGEPSKGKISKPVSRSSSRASQRKTRAKSAEPDRKRKSSIESSYSRKSLSKLSFMKKLRDVKRALSIPRLFEKPKKDTKTEDQPTTSTSTNVEVKKETKKEIKREAPVKKTAEPVYIHIPLKPPEGETDEFSHLEFDESAPALKIAKTQEEEVKKEEDEQSSPIESPAIVNDVQFIYLTPPSDDELLDKPDVPETPMSEDGAPFERVGELKELAKDVVEQYSPKTKKKLSAIGENKDELAPALKDTANIVEDDAKVITTSHRIIIDEEDGLQSEETKTEDDKTQGTSLKSSLKFEASPLLKKKVSFKRRSKDPSKESSYEDIQVKPEADQHLLEKVESVEQERPYLEDVVVKSTSLEEDYNKWSKLSDHEYEPINPPPEEMKFIMPVSQIFDGAPKDISKASSTTSLERRMLGGDLSDDEAQQSVQAMQSQMEEKYFNDPIKTASSSSTSQRTRKSKSKSPSPQPKAKKMKEQLSESSSKFQAAIKDQAGKFKTKLQGIKKPHITLPTRPKFHKPNLNIHFPKIPDKTVLHLPSFSSKSSTTITKTKVIKERQESTESNVGDSKKPLFNFGTYPRIFKKKAVKETEQKSQVHFATVPRAKPKKEKNKSSDSSDRWGGSDTIRVPLHSEDSMDTNNLDNTDEPVASHRYDFDNVAMDDAYAKENQDIQKSISSHKQSNPRWDHGSFHPESNRDFEYQYDDKVTDLDQPDEPQNHRYDANQNKDEHSSMSSLSTHRQGVLEEIDSDEFFLRQKGISQDNIEVGQYLSSEIREAFRPPATNTLSKMEFDNEMRTSNQSLPETKRKQVKKPKRKKTPHVSNERIPYDQEDTDQEDGKAPPPRPKRKSKKARKHDDIVPYQETHHVESLADDVDVHERDNATNAILAHSDDEHDMHYKAMYESDLAEPNEATCRPPLYQNGFGSLEPREGERPAAPPRKHRSLKSLNLSEHDSIMGDVSLHMYNVEVENAPTPPKRQSRTRTRSPSLEGDIMEYKHIHSFAEPHRPPRTRSHSRGTSQRGDDDSISREQDFISYENQTPCVEEPCIEDLRDYMGYRIIDKKKPLPEPPLPPKTPRRKKSFRSESEDTKFATVPRLGAAAEPPTRPLRNYSTLGPSRPPRRSMSNLTDEDKENVDITEYIEIEDDRDGQSGEVLQKIQNRPLPAPPRPPRKQKPLSDITSSSQNILLNGSHESLPTPLEEAEVSTQTEPLPDDFICEEVVHDKTDVVVTPTPQREKQNNVKVELQTPSHYRYEETITHGSLLVEPLNGAKILPDSELTKREHIIQVMHEDDDETSEIPEEFNKLKDPPVKDQSVPRSSTPKSQEFEILKAHKLQVSDLDVDRLTVNELLARKIIVSEIDSSTIHTSELSSKSGSLKIGEVELPPNVIEQILAKLQEREQKSKTPEPEQKKTPIESHPNDLTLDSTSISSLVVEPVEKPSEIEHFYSELSEQVPERPPRQHEASPQETLHNIETSKSTPEAPEPLITTTPQTSTLKSEMPARPPRHKADEKSDSQSQVETPQSPEEPEVDDEPPPRPPQPEYFPSQPPASFYALRAQQYVEGDVPTTLPRKKRPSKAPLNRSSSSESPPMLVARRRMRSSTEPPSIPHLAGQLFSACSSEANNSFKRLMEHVTKNVIGNADGKQDLHVVIVILLVLIAGLILLGWGGNGRTVHHHHWEFFNPPRDI